MIRFASQITLAAFFALGLAPMAFANPVLKSKVTVSSAIVTVGDMFQGADMLAEQPLFRAPRPGTTGEVSLGAVQTAAARVGLTQFDNSGLSSVSVARSGVAVTSDMLANKVREALTARNVLKGDISADITFVSPLGTLYAEDAAVPVDLTDFRYEPRTGVFSARFSIAGMTRDTVLTGRAQLMIDAPYLAHSLDAGAILSAADIEMRRIPLGLGRNGTLPTLDQLVGKQLKRPTRAGILLADNLVAEPQLVTRNELITLIYRAGPLTLTARGRALSGAPAGAEVSVLNLLSNKVITGTVSAGGTVTIGQPAING